MTGYLKLHVHGVGHAYYYLVDGCIALFYSTEFFYCLNQVGIGKCLWENRFNLRLFSFILFLHLLLIIYFLTFQVS